MLVGAGALGFKLGSDACKMKKEGKNDGEILMSMPSLAVEHVAGAVGTVYGAVSEWVSGDSKKAQDAKEKPEKTS